MRYLRLVAVLGGCLLVLGGNRAEATAITGGSTGLSSPTSVLTFDELGNLQGNLITNQFAAYGATFSGAMWDNATFGQAGSTGFSGGDLVVGCCGGPPQPLIISFGSLMSGAAFAAVDQGTTWTLNAYLGGTGGTLVESFNVFINYNPGAGYVGFQNITFDTIEITGAAALSIDNVQMQQAVPEPGTLLLLGGGLSALVLVRRRRA